MHVTEIRTRLVCEDRIRCFVDLTFDYCLVVKGFRVIEGANGMSVLMPKQQRSGMALPDVPLLLSAKLRKLIVDRVLGAYKEESFRQSTPVHECMALREGSMKPCIQCRMNTQLTRGNRHSASAHECPFVHSIVEGAAS
jgi:DNA-binding cell septation regulator SpoVG